MGVPVSARTLRVGVYDNPPKVFMTPEGNASGIFLELLDAIAEVEGWELDYVPVTWAEGLQKLQNNELDLMPDVAHTAARARIMDFHSEFVITSWSQVYARRRFRIEGLGDLNGLRVAVLKDSVQANVLQRLAEGLELSFTLVPADSFDEAFRMVVANQADAVVANQFFGDMVYNRHGLRKTPVILNPVALYFVANRGENADVLGAIDRNIRDWQNRANSPYFQVLARWMKSDSRNVIPTWMSGLMLLLAVSLSTFVVFNALLRSKVDQAVASLRDANAQLRDSEQKWRSYIDHAPFGVFIVNELGLYQELNPMACEMTGYSERELMGQPVSTLVADDFQRLAGKQFASLLEEGFMDAEMQLKKKSGERFWVRICARRLEENRFIGFHEDIQAMKDARKEQLALQAELFHAHKLDAVGRLAGGVAHDYNNMLGVILGGCELMKMKMPPDSPEMEELNHIHSAATRSVKITRQLLAFSRKQDLCPVVVDLNDVINDLRGLLNNLFEKDIRLLWNPSETPLPVKIDPTCVDQILMNLCINARDALAGPGTIEIRTDTFFLAAHTIPDCPGGVYARLHVKDNGPGMDPDLQSKIFDPFFTTKSRDNGTGMGLATVYGLVRQAGGYIQVHSEPGKGAAFEIGLPLVSSTDPSERA
ncbi:MAG: transporter substrate-binding domain-containing protein [Kiritimatiellae bacterium]|nr:transporter substrate-binding domain-containing protein [Kiritimatiellia bacterium]